MLSGLAEPLHRLLRIVGDSAPGSIAAGQGILGWSVVRLCGPLKPLGGGHLIFGYTQSPFVKDSQTVLVLGASLDGFEFGPEKVLMDF
jgi:hypothetical protein